MISSSSICHAINYFNLSLAWRKFLNFPLFWLSLLLACQQSSFHWVNVGKDLKMLSCAKVRYLKETIRGDAKEKANLLNCFFVTVGMKLADTIKPQHQALTTTTTKPVLCIYNARVSYGEVSKKLITLKTNKATGPDGISCLYCFLVLVFSLFFFPNLNFLLISLHLKNALF